MRFFDTHAHLCDPRFDADRDALIATLPQAGAALIMDVCCDVEEWESSRQLIEKYDFIYAAVGMHPHEAGRTTQALLDKTAGILQTTPKARALGEIGLDYHYDFAPRAVQKQWFEAQLCLAEQLDVPVVLHIREAFGDCMDILRAHKGRLRGEMHCFSGSWETARECVDMGLYIAFGGSVTFKNARGLLEAARGVPMERLLLETDCPYLAPEPFRGQRNDPAHVAQVAERLAAIRGEDVEELCERTLQNGCALFGIPYETRTAA